MGNIRASKKSEQFYASANIFAACCSKSKLGQIHASKPVDPPSLPPQFVDDVLPLVGVLAQQTTDFGAISGGIGLLGLPAWPIADESFDASGAA